MRIGNTAFKTKRYCGSDDHRPKRANSCCDAMLHSFNISHHADNYEFNGIRQTNLRYETTQSAKIKDEIAGIDTVVHGEEAYAFGADRG